MALTIFNFNSIGFFKDPYEFLFNSIPNINGLVFFKESFCEVPYILAVVNENNMVIKFDKIGNFPNQDFKIKNYGNIVLGEHYYNYRPFIIYYGTMKKCVYIQVGFEKILKFIY